MNKIANQNALRHIGILQRIGIGFCLSKGFFPVFAGRLHFDENVTFPKKIDISI